MVGMLFAIHLLGLMLTSLRQEISADCAERGALDQDHVDVQAGWKLPRA